MTKTNATESTDTLAAALRHYVWLGEASTLMSPGRTPEAWDAVAARLEAGIEREGLTGDYRVMVADRARDARANAQTLRIRARAA